MPRCTVEEFYMNISMSTHGHSININYKYFHPFPNALITRLISVTALGLNI